MHPVRAIPNQPSNGLDKTLLQDLTLALILILHHNTLFQAITQTTLLPLLKH